jgi:glycosyltransferase involved in cell wall biosynthesis
VEALACGAHVLTRAPAVRETLGGFGCYFDREGDLPGKILECLKSPPVGSKEERSRHARSFTFRRMAEATLRAYETAAR